MHSYFFYCTFLWCCLPRILTLLTTELLDYRLDPNADDVYSAWFFDLAGKFTGFFEMFYEYEKWP